MVYDYPQTQGGWIKCPQNPLIGNEKIGTCFDVHVRQIPQGYRMYFSWRTCNSIACTESTDGIHWGEFKILLEPDKKSGWEDMINRNCVWEEEDGRILMWYTGQANNRSCIGLAVSRDGGNTFQRIGTDPVMIPETSWEKDSVMNPFVRKENGIYRMWYAAGETYEPNVICYAESTDGIHWKKSPLNPIFTHGNLQYDQDRVGGCEVLKLDDGSYEMFYIGYEDINTARICAAVSKDGIRDWKRIPENPIVSPGKDCWDEDACYKPSVIYEKERKLWRLWYNGRCGRPEYVGMAERKD